MKSSLSLNERAEPMLDSMVMLQRALIGVHSTYRYSVVDKSLSELLAQLRHHRLRNPKRWRFPRKDHIVRARQHKFCETRSLSSRTVEDPRHSRRSFPGCSFKSSPSLEHNAQDRCPTQMATSGPLI